MGNIWNNYLQINTLQSTRMLDLETGKDVWDTPIKTSDKYFSHFIHPNQKYLLTKENPKTTKYPRTYNAFDLKTGKSIWDAPKKFPDRKRKVSTEKLGITVYNKEDKDLTYYNYETGESVWSYPKKQLNGFKFINDFYYISKNTEIDKLNHKGEKVWKSAPSIKSLGIWKIVEDKSHEIVISNKSSSKKTISVITKDGQVLKSRDWKISDSDSLLFVKYSQDKINYVKFSGIYQLDMSTDKKPVTIAKFNGKDRQYEFNDNATIIVVRVDAEYHFYNFETLDYKLLSDKLKFEGDDERRVIRFINQSGISVQNQENIAYLSFQEGQDFNKYYKYPKTSEFGTKLLKKAITVAATYIILDQSYKSLGNELSYWGSGDIQFLKSAQIHNRNIGVTSFVGSTLVSKLNEFEQKRIARKNLAKKAKPIAVFSEKRKIDRKRSIVIVNVDPITGEELDVFDIGEKNPVYYVDSLGGTIFYINKANIVTRLRM